MRMLREAPAEGDDSAYRLLILAFGVTAAVLAAGLLAAVYVLWGRLRF